MIPTVLQAFSFWKIPSNYWRAVVQSSQTFALVLDNLTRCEAASSSRLRGCESPLGFTRWRREQTPKVTRRDYGESVVL